MAIEMNGRIVGSDGNRRGKAQIWTGIAAQLFLLVFEREECLRDSVNRLLLASATGFIMWQ